MLIRKVRDLDVLLLLPLLVAEKERKYFSITSTSAIISIHSLHPLRCLWHRLHGLRRMELRGKKRGKKKRDERRTRQRELFATDIFGGISFVFIFSLHFKNETLVMSAQLSSSSSLLIPSLFSLTSSTTSSYVYWWWFSSSLSFSPSFPVFLAHDDHEERERNSVPAIVSWNQVFIVWGQDLQSSSRTKDSSQEKRERRRRAIDPNNRHGRRRRRWWWWRKARNTHEEQVRDVKF